MVETGGKSSLSWCALQPALEPPKKIGLLPQIKVCVVVTDVVMTFLVPAESVYNIIYEMTLSTGPTYTQC